jgi:hypothetical protein
MATARTSTTEQQSAAPGSNRARPLHSKENTMHQKILDQLADCKFIVEVDNYGGVSARLYAAKSPLAMC